MASTYKILGQAMPANTDNADLYTVPSGGQVVVSTITVANTTTSDATYRIFVRPNGATADQATAVVYDTRVDANTTQTLTLGITADASDIISVRSSTGSAITFTAFGLEIV